MVSTSNCIDVQKPLGRLNLDVTGLQVHSPANGVRKGNQYLPIAFALNQKEIRPARPEHVGDLSETASSRCPDLQSYEAENIIGALWEINQILTLEEDIRAHQGFCQGRRADPLQPEDHAVTVVLSALDPKVSAVILAPEAKELTRL
jgi:hypothetical protein